MNPSERKYGLPFFKITIPFINDEGDCIGVIHIRATRNEPIRHPTHVGRYFFNDIDDEIFLCTEWSYHGPASKKEMYDPYG